MQSGWYKDCIGYKRLMLGSERMAVPSDPKNKKGVILLC